MNSGKILDIDFIGCNEKLTKEEEILLHEYFKSNKMSVVLKPKRKTSILIKEKVK